MATYVGSAMVSCDDSFWEYPVFGSARESDEVLDRLISVSSPEGDHRKLSSDRQTIISMTQTLLIREYPLH